MAASSPQLFLYRTLDLDDEGDPYDHGNLRARDHFHAIELLREHFAEFDDAMRVRLYKLIDSDLPGVIESASDGPWDIQI